MDSSEFSIDKDPLSENWNNYFFDLDYITIIKNQFPVMPISQSDDSLDFSLLTPEIQKSLKEKCFYELALMDKTRTKFILLRHIEDKALCQNIAKGVIDSKFICCSDNKTLRPIKTQLRDYLANILKDAEFCKKFPCGGELFENMRKVCQKKDKVEAWNLLIENGYYVDRQIEYFSNYVKGAKLNGIKKM